MEIIRRLLLLIGLLGGILAWIYCRPVVISVAVEDFAASKTAAEQRPTGFLYKDDSLEEFYQSRTEGRLWRVDDNAWQEFYEQVHAATIEDLSNAAMQRRAGESPYLGRLYYLPSERLIDEVTEKLSSHSPLIYMQIKGEGPAVPSLVFIRHNAVDLMGDAPDWLLRPYRPYALWLVVGGVACYIILPRPKRWGDTIRCSGVHAIVLPDILGALLTTFFFALPILIIQMNGATLSIADGAWFIPLAICWLLALFPLVIVGIAAHNASFSVQLNGDSFRITRWNGSREIAYVDVEAVNAAEWRTPRWIKVAGWFIVLFAQRGLLSALILEQGRGAGLDLKLKNGSSQRLWISGLDGWERLVDRLEQHGAVLTPEVQQMCDAQ